MHHTKPSSAALSFLALLQVAVAPVALADSNGTFLNIMPPGNNGYMNVTEGLLFNDDGTLPANFDDQSPLYANLTYADPGIDDAELTAYFKPAPLVPSGNPVDAPSPGIAGLAITRDDFGVPNIDAKNRTLAMFGIGWASAADRLFSMDVARHAGRGRISELVGYDPSLIEQDKDVYAFAGYDETDFQQQYADLVASNGGVGKRADKDITAFVQGINTFIIRLNQGSIPAPIEYVGLGKLPVQQFKKTDVLAIAVFLEYLFGAGGGSEHRNSALLEKLQTDLGPTNGEALWRDLRSTEEPEAPVTTSISFPYLIQGAVNPAAVARPDAGSVVDHPAVEVVGPLPDAMVDASSVSAMTRRSETPAMSNWLAVTAASAVGGHPILVGGPQTSYLVPELLYEFAVNSGGLRTRGVAPVGSPYVVLGRGRNYAFTATAGGSDNTDVRAELLCNEDASPPTLASMGYLYNTICLPIFERVDTWCAGAGQADPAFCDNNPDNVQAVVQRTIHGNVFARATVDGAPVALVKQRASFFKEGTNALAFQKINKNTPKPKSFLKSISKAPGSFNWLYVNETDVFYFHSGLFPVRAAGVDYDLPSWGTGEWEWQGYVATKDHPQELNPPSGYITSWNNKPARDWRASDNNYSYGMSYRVDMLDKGLETALGGGPLTIGEMVEIMGDAGYTDLRGQEILPLALDMIGTEAGMETVLGVLADWEAAGTQRRDRDDDGDYDHASAVAIMDAWWQHMIEDTVGPQLSPYYGDILLGFDNEPSDIGSAYQSGYYGIMEKVLKMAAGTPVTDAYDVLKCADGTASGCRAALVSSLADAVADLTAEFSSADPADWSVDPEDEQIQFRPFGLAEVDPIPWVNRPTFQQVVQVTARK
ncbi:MAG: penicillin acylase family protein [Candidatus Binatia bacterium]